MTHVVEHEGEILPAYTGLNQPPYPKYDEDKLPHDFSTAESGPSSDDNIVSIESFDRNDDEAAAIAASRNRHPSVSGLPQARGTLGMVEMPRPGHDNWHRPSIAEVQRNITDTDRARAVTGLAAAKLALRQAKEK